VGLAFGRFADSAVLEGQRKARERRREHSQHQPREVLFDRHDGRHRWSCRAPCAAWRRTTSGAGGGRRTAGRWTAGPRTAATGAGRRNLDQGVAVEPARRRVGVLLGNLVLAGELVWEPAVDLELDRHEVVAANLAGPAGGDETLHR